MRHLPHQKIVKPAFVVLFLLALAAGLLFLFLQRPFQPEAPDWANATGWLNTPPLSWQSLSGKPVAVVFWSSTCERCIGGLPQALSWQRIAGLNVVFVHSPEFAFEKSVQAAVEAAARLGVSAPIALDHNGTLWPLYSNGSLDTVYVFDGRGRKAFSGFNAASSLAKPLADLAAGRNASFPPVDGAVPKRIYVGYHTSAQEARQKWQPFQMAEYYLPQEGKLFVPYLVGTWYVGSDSVRAVAPGKVWLKVAGVSNVSVVALSGSPARVFVDLKPVGEAHRAGLYELDGNTFFLPSNAGLYKILWNLQAPSEVVLDVPAGFVLYRFAVE